MDLLDDRKKKILQAIVDEYINTAEPVSSSTIAKEYGLDFSSATIRNEMAELEHIGLIEKTHTSSGRVPSPLGYRYYVDELIKDDNISMEEIVYIKSKLETKVNEIEELTKIATHTISEVTHYPTVAIGPDMTQQIIEDIKFVLLGNRVMMAIIITDANLIKETIIKFDEDINQNQVENLNIIFNSKLKGKQLEKITIPFEEYIWEEAKYSIAVIKQIIDELNRVIEEETRIYLEGTNKAFEFPEFKNVDLAKKFVNVIDTKELMLEMLNNGIANDINVYIGNESTHDELKDFSIVTFKHQVDNKDIGTIGIIGPKRMDYSKVISVMKFISKKLNERDDK